METERYFSGYCRMLDAARIVEVIFRDGEVEEADCCYGSCEFQNNCPIAQQVSACTQNSPASAR